MQDYNFWADVLDTFQSSPDWIKALWLLIPPGFVLALMAMVMRYRIASRQTGKALVGELIYSVYRRADGDMQIISHLPNSTQNRRFCCSTRLPMTHTRRTAPSFARKAPQWHDTVFYRLMISIPVT